MAIINLSLSTFFTAIRPNTLILSVVPAAMGLAMAFGDGMFYPSMAVLIIFSVVLLHMAVNLCIFLSDIRNQDLVPELFEYENLLAQNNLLHFYMKMICLLTTLLSVAVWIFLLREIEQPFFTVGLAALVLILVYATSLAHLTKGLWEGVIVFMFQGLFPLVAAYFLQTHEMSGAVLISGAGPGFLAVALKSIKDIRYLEKDRQTNKRTTAVTFGKEFAMMKFLFCASSACLLPILIYAATLDHVLTLLCCGILFFMNPATLKVLSVQTPQALEQAYRLMNVNLIVYGIIFSLGWVL